MADHEALRELATAVVNDLGAASKAVATAESCTGGWVAKAITDVPGSSACFGYGVVSYSNGAKESILGVGNATLQDHGSVSEPVVREMADGVLHLSGADIAVAVSGIAGPEGGTDEEVGWYSYYRDSGLQWMLWVRRGDVLIAAEINRSRFLAELVAALPETDGVAPDLSEGRILLRDATGQVLYQWGAHEAEPGHAPAARLALAPPLGAWSLEYHAAGKTLAPAHSGSVVLGLGSALGKFDAPTAVAVDSEDNLIVADQFNGRIQICNRQGDCSSLGRLARFPLDDQDSDEFGFIQGVAVIFNL